MRKKFQEDLIKDVVVLSGPSHAEEVGLRQATTVTSAAKRMEAAGGSTRFVYE
ncbi:hypothetical protein ACT7DH_08035 [Bacillus pacificus]